MSTEGEAARALGVESTGAATRETRERAAHEAHDARTKSLSARVLDTSRAL